MTIDVKPIALFAFVLALVPWLSFGLNSMDLQPWAGLFFFVAFVFWRSDLNISRSMWAVFVVMMLGFSVGLLASNTVFTFYAARMLYAVLSFFLIVVVFQKYVSAYGYPLQTLIVVNLIWIVVGLLEVFYPQFGSLFSAHRTNSVRGVTSLSAEPSFFGMHLFFMSWLLYLFGYKPRHQWFNMHVLNVFAIFVLAKSSLTILFLMIGFSFYFLFQMIRGDLKTRIFLVAFASCSLLFFVYAAVIGFSGTEIRPLQLVDRTFERGLLIFFFDNSLNARLQAIVLSLQASVSMNYLLPGGFDTFLDSQNALLTSWNGFFKNIGAANYIMSWMGEYVYYFGVFGMVFIGYFLFGSLNGTLRRFFEISFLLILLISAIPSSYPLIPLIVASYWYNNSIEKLNPNSSTKPIATKPSVAPAINS